MTFYNFSDIIKTLAVSNIGVGLSLYFSSVTSALWVHVALSAFLVLKFAFLHLVQFTAEKMVAIIKKDEGVCVCEREREGWMEGGREGGKGEGEGGGDGRKYFYPFFQIVL